MIAIAKGDRFGSLTAEKREANDAKGAQVWTFRCDCGKRHKARVSNVTYTLRTIDWASCKACYQSAGGLAGVTR